MVTPINASGFLNCNSCIQATVDGPVLAICSFTLSNRIPLVLFREKMACRSEDHHHRQIPVPHFLHTPAPDIHPDDPFSVKRVDHRLANLFRPVIKKKKKSTNYGVHYILLLGPGRQSAFNLILHVQCYRPAHESPDALFTEE